MSDFSHLRLVLARERRGLTATSLSEACGVSARTISNWESGAITPSDETVKSLSSILGFPREFFFSAPVEMLADEAATFRSRSRLVARQKHSALAAGTLATEFIDWLSERFELPPVRIPDLAGLQSSVAAELVRNEWGMGTQPVPNVIHLLESRGVVVLSLAQDCQEIDAFSFWHRGRPVVLLNTLKSAERSRMDGAHELAHLVLHKETTGRSEETAADEFAGCFLMPEADVQKRLPRFFSLDQAVALKRRWGVAVSALVYRAHAVGTVSDWQYRSLFLELSKRGYRKSEPDSLPREGSLLLAKVFRELEVQGVSPRDLARELHWSMADLGGFVFGLGATLSGLAGGRLSASQSGTRPTLRVVRE